MEICVHVRDARTCTIIDLIYGEYGLAFEIGDCCALECNLINSTGKGCSSMVDHMLCMWKVLGSIQLRQISIPI